jgi:hypothetical protein
MVSPFFNLPIFMGPFERFTATPPTSCLLLPLCNAARFLLAAKPRRGGGYQFCSMGGDESEAVELTVTYSFDDFDKLSVGEPRTLPSQLYALVPQLPGTRRTMGSSPSRRSSPESVLGIIDCIPSMCINTYGGRGGV